MINIVENTNFRKKDGVKILIKTSKSYINRSTHEIVPELPDGAVAADWATLNGMLRKDQTGDLYEIVHDVEDSEYTYTEVFLTPESYCYLSFANYGNGYVCHAVQQLYPTYAAGTTYAKGDRVVYKNMEYESDLDDNKGNIPTDWGWTHIMPFVEFRDPVYKSLEEMSA